MEVKSMKLFVTGHFLVYTIKSTPVERDKPPSTSTHHSFFLYFLTFLTFYYMPVPRCGAGNGRGGAGKLSTPPFNTMRRISPLAKR
jgi:hypothetical protein